MVENGGDSDNEGDVVFPRPAGKRIRAEDFSSDSDEEDEQGQDEAEDEVEDDMMGEEFDEDDDEGFEDEDDDEDDDQEGGNESGSEERSKSKSASDKSERREEKRKRKEKEKKKKKDKKSKKDRSEKAPKAKKGRYRKDIFLDMADVGSDEEEDEEEEEGYREEKALDHELLAFQKEAEARAATRHEANRRFQEASASDVVADIESRYRRQKGSVQQGYGAAEGYMAESTRRSLVPGVNDPGIYMVRTKTGMEQTLVRSILLKSIDRQRKGQKLQIKSVFCTNTAGYIYIEAMNEPFAREAITGLHGIYYTTLKQVPIKEMSMLLTLTVKKKPFKEGQWCRMRRGPSKGDLARVLKLLEGGTKALVQVVPRPDYHPATGKAKGSGAARPLQRLFLAEEAKAQGHDVERKRHPVTGEFCEFWNNEYYNRGFLFKEVKVDTFLAHATNPLPRLEEVTMFQEQKRDGEDSDEEKDDQASGHTNWNSKQGIMKELAKLEEEQAGDDPGAQFRPGDTIQVVEGEQRNMRGVIVSINDRTGLAVVQPLSEYQLGQLSIETRLLIKYIRPGAHVKVLNGKHMGQTGRVVSVYRSDGDNIAAILTDGINNEITVNMGHLQVTSEVTTGLNSLGGYELYDLLILNANDYGVVVYVGTEHLSVLTVNDILKNVSPMEVKGKKTASRGATGAFDHLKNPLSVGDTVSVIEGTHAKKSGTIKHINRSVLWLHSTSHLANSGIFVVKGKSVLLAGSKVKGNSNTAATLLNAAFNNDTQPGATLIRSQAFRKGGNKDEDHGKAVKLTQGGFKGHLGRIVDATNTHYSVELHGRMKMVNIPKNKVKFVDGDQPSIGGSYVSGGRSGDGNLIPNTPFLSAQTPLHLAGSETPSLYGNMTPSRPETPGRENVWNPATQLEVSSNSLSQRQQQDQQQDQQQSYSGGSSESGWYGNSWGTEGDNDWGAGNDQPLPSPAPSSFEERNEDDWDVDMIVTFRKGPKMGSYAILVDRPRHGKVQVRMRESSSTGRRSDDNPIEEVNVSELRLAEPRRKDSVKVLNGAHKGFVGKVRALLDKDVVLSELPGEVFKLSQVAWLHTR